MKKYEDGLVQMLLCVVFAVLGWMVLAPANRYEFLVDFAMVGAVTKAWLLVMVARRRARRTRPSESSFAPGVNSLHPASGEESLAVPAQ